MTAENEIVMVGGISQSTGEVFSNMKVLYKVLNEIVPFQSYFSTQIFFLIQTF